MNTITRLSYPAIDFSKGLVAVNPHSTYSRARPRASFNPMKRRLTQARRNALLQYSTSPVISTMTTTPMLAVCPVYVYLGSFLERALFSPRQLRCGSSTTQTSCYMEGRRSYVVTKYSALRARCCYTEMTEINQTALDS